jgi:putative transposase
MQRLQAYKFELKQNGEQQRNMRRFAGSCRFLFNKTLALQKERHEQGEKKLGLTEWKAQEETPWLSDTPGQALQQALKNLERAYRNFFAKRADFPRFKKKGQSDSFRYPQGFRLDQSNNRIFLPREVSDAARSSAAGTHQSDSVRRVALSAIGISGL